MQTISILSIGFTVFSCVLLFSVYVFFLRNVNKNLVSVTSCLLLLAGIASLQMSHLAVFLQQQDPSDSINYRFLLFLLPSMFYFFSRTVLFPDNRLNYFHLLLLLPISFAFLLDKEVAIPLSFFIGTCYSFWLANIVYRLRNHQKLFKIEFFLFGFFALLAVVILLLGLQVAYSETVYFYYFYTNGIALAFVLVISALIVYPDLLSELNEVVKLSYSTSTLNQVDVDALKIKLNKLMTVNKLYQNEELSLPLLADEMGLNSHQLSELTNIHYGVSFSQFVREHRVEAAKYLLTSQPNASILAISLEIGFKSQSNFYVAFKQITGQSPGSFRKIG